MQMPYQAAVYNVMIASPSDIQKERKVVREILAEWNNINAEKRNIVLMPIGWETHSTPETGGHPQDILNGQILERSDLLVGLFWTRVGTPTENYVSGSIEEINKHVNAGKPAMLYFSDQPAEPSRVDPEQYRRLQEFKDRWKALALLGECADPSDFREKFNRHLQIKLNDDPYFQRSLMPSRRVAGTVEYHKRANDFLPRVATFIAEAKKEIWLAGVNFYSTAPEHKCLFVERLRQGVNVRFLILDPTSPYRREVAKGFSNSDELLKTQCDSTVAALREIYDKWKHERLRGQLEIRLFARAPNIRFYFFDRGCETGFTYLVPHLDGLDSPNLPGFLAENVEDGIAPTYADRMQGLWEKATRYEDWLRKT